LGYSARETIQALERLRYDWFSIRADGSLSPLTPDEDLHDTKPCLLSRRERIKEVVLGSESRLARSMSERDRIPELDGLRGIAIGLVLIWHYFFVIGVPTPGTLISYLFVGLRLTWTGVDLFFVLSGFLIGGILLDAQRSSNYLGFSISVASFRIVPV